MDIRKLTDQVFVSPQIDKADLEALCETGVRSIICNRPDGEVANQPTFREISDTAGRLGIETRYIPVDSSGVQDTDVRAFGAALEKMPKPVLAYCRSGTRSAMLWSLSQAATLPASKILSATEKAGYDLAGFLRPILEAGANQGAEAP